MLLPVAEGLADSAASAMLDSEASSRGDSAASFVDLGAVVWNWALAPWIETPLLIGVMIELLQKGYYLTQTLSAKIGITLANK